VLSSADWTWLTIEVDATAKSIRNLLFPFGPCCGLRSHLNQQLVHLIADRGMRRGRGRGFFPFPWWEMREEREGRSLPRIQRCIASRSRVLHVPLALISEKRSAVHRHLRNHRCIKTCYSTSLRVLICIWPKTDAVIGTHTRQKHQIHGVLSFHQIHLLPALLQQTQI
jgi:hypothetical protein